MFTTYTNIEDLNIRLDDVVSDITEGVPPIGIVTFAQMKVHSGESDNLLEALKQTAQNLIDTMKSAFQEDNFININDVGGWNVSVELRSDK